MKRTCPFLDSFAKHSAGLSATCCCADHQSDNRDRVVLIHRSKRSKNPSAGRLLLWTRAGGTRTWTRPGRRGNLQVCDANDHAMGRSIAMHGVWCGDPGPWICHSAPSDDFVHLNDRP